MHLIHECPLEEIFFYLTQLPTRQLTFSFFEILMQLTGIWNDRKILEGFFAKLESDKDYIQILSFVIKRHATFGTIALTSKEKIVNILFISRRKINNPKY